MIESLDFLLDVEHGRYRTKLPWPERPKMPAILNVPVRKLTSEQLKQLPEVAAHYEAQDRNYREQLEAYRADQNRLDNEAYEALMADFGLDKDDPFVIRMYSIAYESGHSSGWSSIYGEMSDLMPLYELYAAVRAGGVAPPKPGKGTK